ncbi:twinfilin [Ischnura elegans]|uniref:twinfilin n=1 Tax=Ischnura elegans TaxID=197161 RepID=UPI001ED887CE|nr:twinfilin [Ischnura elegans]
MSHQTGIRANESLKKFFGKCRDGHVRVFKVSIENEELTLSAQSGAKGTWEQDYDKLVLPLIKDDQPCYILYRFDSRSSTGGYEWALISWSPDDSSVRQKMLYASTKATLKQEFGGGQIKEEIHATVKEEVSLSGFRKHKANARAPAPLTPAEEELARMRIEGTTAGVGVGVDSRQQTLSGVAFPISAEAKDSIMELASGRCNYVQLKIDLEKEEIHLSDCDSIGLDRLPGKVPSNSARYHLYTFKHTHEGDLLEAIVFIYSMPGYSCSIKERMLYSSCKGPLLNSIEDDIGLEIVKKMEIDSGSELTEDFLQEELHPKKNLHRPKFAKPKGPPNRGAKRLTKGQDGH